MIAVTVKATPAATREVLVEIDRALSPLTRRRLHKVLAARLANELADHFRTRNAEPNKRGWSKTGFWGQVARSTGVTRADEAGAEVSVADQRFRIHVHGGTIKPTGGRKYLTIPLVPEARGLNVASYERKTRKKLFRIGRARVLFETKREGTQPITRRTTASRWDAKSGTRSKVTLRAMTQLRAVYALAKESRIKPDPNALPDPARLEAALREEADDLLARQERRGIIG